MTAATAPASRRAAAHAAPVHRPRLRVVDADEGAVQRSRRRTRLMVGVTAVLAALGLFGLVVSHVALTQNQFRLQRLQQTATDEQARYERLRLQVAQLESPARVVATAQERLGMVPPPSVRYLAPTPATTASAAPPSASTRPAAPRATASASAPVPHPATSATSGVPSHTSAAVGDWTTVKQHLAGRP